ncbi:phosphate/phosphite/phosphonate ABC transporter substrate-binding protein [Lyngbya sp. CCY1209]|uniref:phosphate/phosphite/phosphonate ABC transporter substrate-binding protein n=1 Tax=Lyngbya sp. CCY1209 TaxID=2886103 RepID=UPI002D20B623|nr:phosphate/phosphite/phosphonate ABC transporter substrate-binding protein [Lyngbya sp. CCY1209]MEB3887085.1 phosphate/phosphite/phosphonate ABC transporter substrate-binding protein [Lyngbya sp. CCY1209]
MLPNFCGKLILLGLVTAVVGCSPPAATPPSPEAEASPAATSEPAGEPIVLADVSKNAAQKIRQFQPMADYLAENLGEYDIGAGEVKVAPNLEAIAAMLKSGEVDIYFDSPYPAMRVSDASGAEPVLRRWKGGNAEYFGVIFIRKDSGIESIEDLQGRTIAFEEDVSTSGYFLPLNYLIDAGFNPVQKASPLDDVAPDEIGYVFSNDDENTIQWVISGNVEAGAADLPTFMAIPEESRSALKILAETEKLARHIVLVRPGMDPELVEGIKAVLMDMDKTPAGQAVLESFEKTAKFDAFPPEADLNRMRELYDRVQNR